MYFLSFLLIIYIYITYLKPKNCQTPPFGWQIILFKTVYLWFRTFWCQTRIDFMVDKMRKTLYNGFGVFAHAQGAKRYVYNGFGVFAHAQAARMALVSDIRMLPNVIYIYNVLLTFLNIKNCILKPQHLKICFIYM